MRTFDVVIKGTKPIILHNPAGMTGGGKPAGPKSIPSFEEEAAASCYWTAAGDSLAFPGDNIQAAMIASCGRFKVGKQGITPYVSGCIEIKPELVPFGTKEYKIDTRRVVIQRQGILRSRAKLPSWELRFSLEVDSDWIDSAPGKTLAAVLGEAGRRTGIGDFRPQKKGKFGKFVVASFEERAI